MRKLKESDFESMGQESQLICVISYKTGIPPRELMDLPDNYLLYYAFLLQQEAEANS